MQPKSSQRMMLRMALCCIFLPALLIGCKAAPTTNTIVAKAQSPDGKTSALLVDRYYHTARVSDGFFLILVPSSQSVSEAINAKNIGNSAVLIATWASKVRLRWEGNNTLLVGCDSCGLEAIDIIRKLDHFGSIRIIYQGFPKHTAYS